MKNKILTTLLLTLLPVSYLRAADDLDDLAPETELKPETQMPKAEAV